MLRAFGQGALCFAYIRVRVSSTDYNRCYLSVRPQNHAPHGFVPDEGVWTTIFTAAILGWQMIFPRLCGGLGAKSGKC